MKNGREEINVFLFKNNCFQCFGFPVSLEANNDNNNDEDEFGCKKMVQNQGLFVISCNF